MFGQQEYGLVYHIDFELLRYVREMDLQVRIKKIDGQISDAERDAQLLIVAEHALGELQAVLEHMRDIAVKAASASDAGRSRLSKKFELYKAQADIIIKSATFGGINLLDGSMDSINSIIAAVNETLNLN